MSQKYYFEFCAFISISPYIFLTICWVENFCFSIFQRSVWNKSVSFPCENRRIRLGPHTSHFNQRQQNYETPKCRLCKLRHKVSFFLFFWTVFAMFFELCKYKFQSQVSMKIGFKKVLIWMPAKFANFLLYGNFFAFGRFSGTVYL